VNRKNDLHLSGAYHAAPLQMLEHAAHLALEVAAAVASGKHARGLVTLVADERLTTRAAGLIVRSMLRSMTDKTDPTPADFRRLVADVVGLSRES
jgi:hypothetical protein